MTAARQMIALSVNRSNPPGQNAQTIHQMGHLFDHLPAGLILPPPPVGGWGLIQPDPLHQLRHLAPKRAPGSIKRVEIAPMIPDSGDQPCRSHGFGNRLCGLKIGGKRLFYKERQACRQNRALCRAMCKGGHTDEDRIKRHVIQHRFDAGMRSRTAACGQCGGTVQIGVGNCLYDHIREAGQNIQMALCNAPRPDKSDACQGLHCRCPLLRLPVGNSAVINSFRGPGHGGRGEGLLETTQLAVRHLGRRCRVAKRRGDTFRQGRGRPCGHKERVIFAQRVNNTAGARGDDRKTGGHRLQCHKRQAFEQTGQHKKIRGAHEARYVIVRAHDCDAGQPLPGYLVFHHIAERTVPYHDQPRRWPTLPHDAKGLHQSVMVLLCGEPPHMQQQRLVRANVQRLPVL